MSKIKFTTAVALLAGLLCFSAGSMAAVLLEENWDSGAIDTGKWTKLGSPFLFDLGSAGLGNSGDFALFLAGPSYSYADVVYSAASFNRGDTLRCTFRMFRNGGGLLFTGVNGPWALRNSLSGTYPSLEQIEAGFSRVLDGASLPNLYYLENRDYSGGWIAEDVPVDSAIHTAFDNAIGKANGFFVRVTLGDTTGAKLEWSQDGVNFQVVRTQDDAMDLDTIGLPVDTSYKGANRVSGSSTVWVAFGAAGEGTTNAYGIVDDIVVETGATLVEDWSLY